MALWKEHKQAQVVRGVKQREEELHSFIPCTHVLTPARESIGVKTTTVNKKFTVNTRSKRYKLQIQVWNTFSVEQWDGL